jgi:hypothetical protein
MDYLPHLRGATNHFGWRGISDFKLFNWLIYILIFLLCDGHLLLSGLALLVPFYLFLNYRLLIKRFIDIIFCFFGGSFLLFTLELIPCPLRNRLIIIRHLLQVTRNKLHIISLNLSEIEFDR